MASLVGFATRTAIGALKAKAGRAETSFPNATLLRDVRCSQKPLDVDLGFRPQHALASPGHAADALAHKFLNTLPLVRIRRVQVALGINGDAVHAVELPGLPPAIPEICQLFHGVALDDA